MNNWDMGLNLLELLEENAGSSQALAEALNDQWMAPLMTRYNSEFAVRYFARPDYEEITKEPRLLTTFRTRLGSLIEYGLGVTLDQLLEEEYGDGLRLSFAVAHAYPDYFFRNRRGGVLARLDCKLLHDESDEYSARFDLARSEIDADRDLLLYGAWQWQTNVVEGVTLEYPYVLELLVVPADDIAAERDRRHVLLQGKMADDGSALLASGNPDTNFGKINRIVASTRRDAPDLAPSVRAFLAFSTRHSVAPRRLA